LKKLHLLLLRSYLGPFVLTFFIVLFIFLMQFVWKYIDDFVGKGLEPLVIAELLFYASANLVPMSLPLAVLLSSIMTMGNLAEQYELVAMKSSGLSLFKILAPLIIFIGLLGAGAFYFNNTISPFANLKFKSLLWDVTRKKPSMELKEGVFYNGIEGYSIRVMKKNKESNALYDVLIYQHDKQSPGNRRVIRAKEGEMIKSPNGQNLMLHLKDGVSYDEIVSADTEAVPHTKNEFSEDFITMDLSGFDLQRSDEDLWKSHMKMLSMVQLREAIDSLQLQSGQRAREVKKYMDRSLSLNDTLKDINGADTLAIPSFADMPIIDKRQAVNVAMNMTRNAKNYMSRTKEELAGRSEYISKHKIEWHRKLTLSLAVVLLFFIGAPLGAIIKKGGLGMPVIFSVVFFLIYHISSITGEKMVETGKLSPFEGMWLSSLILLPIAVFLTYKAAKDAALFDWDVYVRITDRVNAFFRRRVPISRKGIH
jgi:lipopolysaccharide export system permease protein